MALSVNEALSRRSALLGQPVTVEGILDLSESIRLLHYPKAERIGQPSTSILYVEAREGLSLNDKALATWEGKRVRASGYLEGAVRPEDAAYDWLGVQRHIVLGAVSLQRI